MGKVKLMRFRSDKTHVHDGEQATDQASTSNDDTRQSISTNDSKRSFKSLAMEKNASESSLSPDSVKTSNTASTSLSSRSLNSPELESPRTLPVPTILEASESSLSWDPPFPFPSEKATSELNRPKSHSRGRSSKKSKMKRSASAKRSRESSTSLRRYGSDGEDSLKRSTRPTRFHDCLVTLDYAPTNPLKMVIVNGNTDKIKNAGGTKSAVPIYVSADCSGKSYRCICGRGDECTGIAAAFHILDDPRGAYTKLPKLQREKKNHFKTSMNRLRSLLLQSLVPSDQIEDFDEESRGKRRYIANHHFHPELVAWAADKTHCDIPMFISEEEMTKLQVSMTDECIVTDKEGKVTNQYYVLANYDREQTKKDLKRTLAASVTRLRPNDKKLIKRMSSRKVVKLSRDDKRLIKKMSSRKLMSVISDDQHELDIMTNQSCDSTTMGNSLDKLIEARTEVSRQKLATEATGEESAEGPSSRPSSRERGSEQESKNLGKGTENQHERRKDKRDSTKKSERPSFNLNDARERKDNQDTSPTSTPRPSLVLENSFKKTLGCSMQDLLKDNSSRSQGSSASNFVPSFPSGESTQENVVVTNETRLSGDIGVAMPPRPAFLDLDQNEKDVLHSKVSAFESRRRSVFSVKMMSTSLRWRSALIELENGLDQTTSAEHWVHEASQATHNVVHDAILESEGTGQTRLDASVGDASQASVPVFSGYVSSCIADELTRTRPQLEAGVNNLERTGQAIIEELEAAEVRVIQAWDAYDISARSFPKKHNAISEKSEAPSTDLWAVQMRYRAAVANQPLAWKMASGKLTSLFDSAKKAEKERRDWLRGLLVEVLSRTPENSASQESINKIQGIIQEIDNDSTQE